MAWGMARPVPLTLAAGLVLLVLPSCGGHNRGEGESEYCKEMFGPLSVFDEGRDQCVCVRGSTFDGSKCVPDRPGAPPRAPPAPGPGRQHPKQGGGMDGRQPPLGGEVGEWCPGLPARNPVAVVLSWVTPRWLKGIVRFVGGLFGFRFERARAYEECADKRRQVARNETATRQAHHDILKLENRHLFSSLQTMLAREEELRRELDGEVFERTMKMEKLERSREEAERQAQALAKEKDRLLKRLRDIQEGKVPDKGVEATDEDVGKLKSQNDDLMMGVKAAEYRAGATAAKVESMESKLDESREREKEMFRELKELRMKLERGDAKALADAHSKQSKQASKDRAELDAKCVRKYGGHSEFDGQGGCRCMAGYVARQKRCVARDPGGPGGLKAPPSQG